MQARSSGGGSRRQPRTRRAPGGGAATSSPRSAYPQAVGLVLACALILMVVAGTLLTGQEGEPLEPILVTTGEWAPYSGEGLPSDGIASALITAVFQQIGYQPELRYMPWPRAEQAARENDTSGGVRATFPYARSPQREKRFYYSDPILTVELSLFYDAGTNPAAAGIDSADDLEGFSVVPIRGYSFPPGILEHLAGDTAQDNVEAFELMLASERPLLVAEATQVGQELLAGPLAEHASRIRTAPRTFPTEIYLMASKRNPNNLPLIRRFDRALAELEESGTLAQIEAGVREAIARRHTVQLQPLTPDGRIEGFLTADGSEALTLPRGTRVVVQRWSANYLEPQPAGTRAFERVPVRILNGPQSGKELYVDERTIVLP